MPTATQNQDIKFQPQPQGYSYSNGPKIKEKKPNTFFTLTFGIFGFLVLFFILLFVLNFFYIFSLRNVSPLFGFLPTVKNFERPKIDAPFTDRIFYDAKNNIWIITGTLHGYSGNLIEVKSGKKIIKLEFSSTQSVFYKSGAPDTLSELEKKENIGKRVEVRYIEKNSDKKIIQKISIFN